MESSITPSSSILELLNSIADINSSMIKSENDSDNHDERHSHMPYASSGDIDFNNNNSIEVNYCFAHDNKVLTHFCDTCTQLLCEECIQIKPNVHLHHDVGLVSETGLKHLEDFKRKFEFYESKYNSVLSSHHGYVLKRQQEAFLNQRYQKAFSDIENMHKIFNQLLDERRREAKTELDHLYCVNKKLLMKTQASISKLDRNASKVQAEIESIINFETAGLLDNQSNFLELLHVRNPIETKVELLLKKLDLQKRKIPLIRQKAVVKANETCSIEFVGGYPSVKQSLINTFGYLSTSAQEQMNAPPSATKPNQPVTCLIRREKMLYNYKFGKMGDKDGEFNEPSGVAVMSHSNEIVVTDTISHHVQVFDRDGNFKFKIKSADSSPFCFPNRICICKQTGDIIITERNPVHQVNVFTKCGQFKHKFGAGVLHHPRAICCDDKGMIIIAECKIMRVVMFDQRGFVISKFSCAKYLQFPNSICVNNNSEIFISDNRAHSIKVFNYAGQYLRRIGGEGITNYPIGVIINTFGHVVIADNHNSFNLTVFTQDGMLINAYESRIKHAQCFDIALMEDNTIVLTSKDNHVYIYKYLFKPNRI